MKSQPDSGICTVVRRYADAWAANDLRAVGDYYHDEVAFHYFGRSPFAGTHRGKATCLATLKQVRDKTNRKLVSVRDVLAAEHFGLIVAVERFDRKGVSVEVERMLWYAVGDASWPSAGSMTKTNGSLTST